jgi:hypothetical protein
LLRRHPLSGRGALPTARQSAGRELGSNETPLPSRGGDGEGSVPAIGKVLVHIELFMGGEDAAVNTGRDVAARRPR